MRKVILIPNASIINPDPNYIYLVLRDWQIHKKVKYNNVFIANHAWVNNEQLILDYDYIDKLYQIIINKLAIQLNELHGINYPIKAWKVLIGPWVFSYLSIVYEKWVNITMVLNNYDIVKVLVSDFNFENKIAKNYDSFTNLALSHKWNEELYINIIKQIDNVIIEKSDKLYYHNAVNIEKSQYKKTKFLFLLKFYSIFTRYILRNHGVMFYISNITNFNILKFSFLNKSLPIIPIINENHDFDKVIVNKLFRVQNLKYNSTNEFEKIISNNILKHLPYSFIENFNRINKDVQNKFGTNTNLKYIITSTGYYNTLFSFFIANSIEKNKKIICIQHGGVYGTALKTFHESHETFISDIYLTWGWNNRNKNVVPFYTIKSDLKIKNKEREKCTIFLNGNDLYILRLSSEVFIHSINPILEFDGLISLINILSINIQNNILFRGYPFDYGWNDKEYFKNRVTNFELDSNSSVSEIFNKSKIAIFTLSSTGYLESLVLNIPTILILTKDRPIREEALPYFNLLKDNYILFDNYHDAANHINLVWDSLDDWWQTKQLQNDLQIFIKQYIRKTNNISFLLNKILYK